MALRRLLERLRGCAHDGRLSYVRVVAPGAEAWRCERCGDEVVYLDVDLLEAERKSQPPLAA